MELLRPYLPAFAGLAIGAGLLTTKPVAAQEATFPERVLFDASAGEIPEGVAVDQVGNVYVSFWTGPASSGKILKFTPTGQRSVFAELSAGVAGLAVDAYGNLLAASHGVYRIDRDGKAVLLPGTENILAANALAFDQRRNLYITESFSLDPPLTPYPGCNPEIPAFGRGGIWRLPPGECAELWVRDDLLTGLCPSAALPFPYGANGIAYREGVLYVVNSDRATIVRVPVLADGAPGPVTVVTSMPNPQPAASLPSGGDGIAIGVQGNLYVTMPFLNAVVRISPDGKSWETLGTASDKLDFPVSLAFGLSETARTQLFVTSMATVPGGAGPSLVKLETGSSGAPVAPAMAAPGSWTRKANMPIRNSGAAACALDGILYVVGGEETFGGGPELSTLYAYDPKTDSWTRKADMPTARRWAAACVLDGIIYVLGGGGFLTPPTDAVEAYDPKTDTWVSRAPLPTPRSGVASCAVSGILYAIGGFSGPVGTHPALAQVDAYDPKTDQWTKKANLPRAAASLHGAHCVNELIYFCVERQVFGYDSKADCWTTLPLLPSWGLAPAMAGFSSTDGIVYGFGGELADHLASKFVLAFDAVSGQFARKRAIPLPWEGMACATIDGNIFLAGGGNKSPLFFSDAIMYNDLWVFDPQGGIAPQLLEISRDHAESVRLRWQGEAKRRYGLQSTLNLAKGPWSQCTLATGSKTVLATNEITEATVPIDPTGPPRFFRVLEVD